MVVFLDGVSGMFMLLPKDVGGRSTLRLRLEIKPVDMKAAGSGFAILYASGVSNDSLDEDRSDSCREFGRRAPIGSDLEKPGNGLGTGSLSTVVGAGMSSAKLEAEDDGLSVLDKG